MQRKCAAEHVLSHTRRLLAVDRSAQRGAQTSGSGKSLANGFIVIVHPLFRYHLSDKNVLKIIPTFHKQRTCFERRGGQRSTSASCRSSWPQLLATPVPAHSDASWQPPASPQRHEPSHPIPEAPDHTNPHQSASETGDRAAASRRADTAESKKKTPPVTARYSCLNASVFP
jgi:hypothetical protein